MHNRAITAYVSAWILAGVSLLAGWRAVQTPWLVNQHGETISLWKSETHRGTAEFPYRSACQVHTSFCASWKTATFLFTLVLLPELLTLLALLFSFALQHRKKTVVVVKYLVGFSLVGQLLGLYLWRVAYLDIDHILKNGHWTTIGGHRNIMYSILCQSMLFALMLVFRPIVSRPINEDEEDQDADSDEYSDYLDTDDDNVSIPDDLPPEQIDFYVFNKRARRRRLEDLVA